MDGARDINLKDGREFLHADDQASEPCVEAVIDADHLIRRAQPVYHVAIESEESSAGLDAVALAPPPSSIAHEVHSKMTHLGAAIYIYIMHSESAASWSGHHDHIDAACEDIPAVSVEIHREQRRHQVETPAIPLTTPRFYKQS